LYKKYITKKGKKVGPYYYDSIRLKNGRVKSVYLGSDEKKARQKLKVLKKESSKAVHKRSSATLKKSLNPRSNAKLIGDHNVHVRDRVFLSIVLIMMLVSFMHFGGIIGGDSSESINGGFVNEFRTFSDMAREGFSESNKITGEVIFSNRNEITGESIFSKSVDPEEHSHDVSFLVSESSEYRLNFENVEKLLSLKVSGRIAYFEGGIAKVFLSDVDSGDTYLVYDSELSKDENILDAVGITGSVVLEEKLEKSKSYKDIVSSLTGFNVVDSKGKFVNYGLSNGSNGTAIIDLRNKDVFEIEYPKKEGWIAYEEYSSRGLIEPTNISFERVFGFDFSGLNISRFNETNTSFSTSPEGSYLYGCSFWDFEFGICLSDWVFFFDLNKTNNYTVSLTTEVMAFAEGILDLDDEEEKKLEEVVEEVEENKTDFLIDILDVLNITSYGIDSFDSICEGTCKMKNVWGNNFLLKVYVKDSILDLDLIETESEVLEGGVYSLSIIDGIGSILLGGGDGSELVGGVDDQVGGITEFFDNGNFTEEVVQFGAVIDQPVKWKKKIILDSAKKDVEFEIPDTAENITLKKIVSGKILNVISAGLDEGNGTIINLTEGNSGFSDNLLNSMTGNAITGMAVAETPLLENISSKVLSVNVSNNTDTIFVDDLVNTVEVEYETPGPRLEVQNKTNGFRVVLKSDIEYVNIFTFLDIPETPMNKVRLYQVTVDNVTGREYRIKHNYTLYGSNNTGLANYIEWMIPTSGDDTFDIQTEINATAAIHLDENYVYISDIFDEVQFEDVIWSETIYRDDYVRVTFEKNLTNGRLIDVIARSNGSLSYFEIYEANTTNLVGKSSVVDYPEVQYIEVSGLSKPTDVFDFKFMNLVSDPEDYKACVKLGYWVCDRNPESSENCHAEVEEDCNSPVYDLNRTSTMEFDFIHDDVINSTQAEGMIVYIQSESATPRYRFWNESDDFEAEQSALATGSDGTDDIAWVVIKGNHERNEMILGTQDIVEDINIQIYNGTAWNNLTEVTTTAEIENQRQFDIAYEDISGDALIVYENSNGHTNTDVAYRIWNGTGISPETVFTEASNNGEILWVKLFSEPGTDNIMLLTQNDAPSSFDLYAVVWNGTGFDTDTEEILNGTVADTTQHMDFRWESKTRGEGLVMYGVGTNIMWRTYSSATGWGKENPTDLGQSDRSTRLCSDPTSDHIGLILFDGGNDINVNVFDGTSMLGGAPSQEGFAESHGVYNSNVGCAWVNSSTAVFGFVDNGLLAIDWITFSKTALWSTGNLGTSTSTTTNFATDDIEALRFVKHPTTDEIMVAAIDNLEDLTTIRWEGTTPIVPGHSLLESATQVDQGHTEDARFDWFRYDPTPNVTSLNPTGETFTVSTAISLNATIADNLVVDDVLANVTHPNATVEQVVLADADADGVYNVSFTGASNTGTYTVRIIANDTSTHKNINSTETTTFIAADAPGGGDIPPTVTLNGPANGTVYTEVGKIVLNATVEDAEDSTLFVRIYGSNGTTSAELDSKDLLYYNESDANASFVDYNWTAPVLDASDDYLLLVHLDNNSLDFGESYDSVFDFAPADGVQNGTIQSLGAINISRGKFGGSYFSTASGADDTNRVDFGDQDTWIDEGNISYLMWVKPRSITATKGILDKRLVETFNADGFSIRQVDRTLRIRFDQETWDTTDVFNVKTWTHIAVVFNASNGAFLYLDGRLNGSYGFDNITANNINFAIGNARSNLEYTHPFAGWIDEVAIINRTLGADEVLDAYRLKSGNHTWYYQVNDSGGNKTLSNSQWFLIDRKPNVTSLSFTPTGPNTTLGLNCTFTPYDDLDSTLNATIKWYNGSNTYSTTVVEGMTSGSAYTHNVSAYVHRHYQEWNCSVLTTDRQGSNASKINSTTRSVVNFEPGAPTLNTPIETTTYIDRVPTFNWTPPDEFGKLPNTGDGGCGATFFCDGRTSDPDEDQVTYSLNISCTTGPSVCDDNQQFTVTENITNCDSNGNSYLDNQDNCNFTLPNALSYFIDDGKYYTWTVITSDPNVTEPDTPVELNYNISVYVAIAVLNKNANFGTMIPGTTNSTSGCSPSAECEPQPIWLQNAGNTDFDVNLTGPSDALFTAISNPHAISYFSVNVNNGTEGQSFNMTDSIVSYTALPAVGTDILFVNDFGWNDSADEITIDVNVSVPANETEGTKGTSLAFTGWYYIA
jgi:hypothetical protein